MRLLTKKTPRRQVGQAFSLRGTVCPASLTVAFLLASLSLSAQPQRIVSTSPSITETMFAVGAGSRVAAVSDYCHYPPEVTKLPRVGSFMRPNAEVIARMQPGLVIVQKLPNNLRSNLQQLGLKVLEVDTGDLAKNIQSMREIARAAGAGAAGETLINQIQEKIDELRRTHLNRPKRSVLFIVGRTPGRLEGIIAVGSGSYLNELIDAAGGRNVFAGAAAPYPKVALETVVRLKPDVIIDMGEMAETTGVTEERKRAVELLWTSRPEIRSSVYAVASDIYVVPGPRMVDAAREIARMLHAGPRR
jgi:iron complex transport system substrate-binding protein